MDAGTGKLWVTCSFRLTEDEKAALEILSQKKITTPSRLVRFAVRAFLLQQPGMKESLHEWISSSNV